jgi:transposase
MTHSLTVRKPRVKEVRQLQKLLEGELNAWQRRRAEAIVLYAAGMGAAEIAQALGAHLNTIYADLHAFDQGGVNAVAQLRITGAPVQISEAQRAEILQVAQQPPTEFGLPYGRWSLSKLRTYLIKARVVKRISREHLRRVLKKGALHCGACAGNCSALIPNGWRF